MPIAIKASELKNPQTIEALRKVANFPFKRAQVTMSVKMTIKDVQDKSKSLQDRFQNLVKKYTEIKEDGTYEIPEDKQAEWNKDFEAFNDQEVQLLGGKIFLNDLDGAGLTPVDMMHLEPFVLQLDTVKDQ